MISARRWERATQPTAVWLGVGLAVLALAILLSFLPPLLVAALLVAIVFGLAVARWPWLGFAALVASVPVQRLGAIEAGTTVTLTRLCFPVAVAAFAISITVRRERLRSHIILVPFFALLAVMAVSVLDADELGTGLNSISGWSVSLVALVMAYHFLAGQSVRRVTLFVGILAASGVFEATFGLIQSLLALGPASFLVTGDITRAFGTFGRPNSYAGFLAIVFFPSLWVGIHYATRVPETYRKYRSQRRLGMAASRSDRWVFVRTSLLCAAFLGSSAVIMSGIILSYSRGAWLGVATATLVTALLYHRITRFLALLAIPALGVLFLGASSVIPGSISERLTADTSQFQIFDVTEVQVTSENFATAERVAHWQAGWRMFADEPALGVGAGNYNASYPDYYVSPSFRISQGHAHNYYIHTLAETGLLGLLAYLTLICGLLVLALKTIRGMPAGFWRMLTLGATGTVVSVAVHNMFENLHVLNIGIVISLVWALIIIAHSQWRTKAATEVWNST